jgi:hypothetical protein
VRRKIFCTFFTIFTVLRGFLRCKQLIRKDKHRSKPSQKNHTKKPMEGLWVFGTCGKVIIVKVEKHTDRVESESVASSWLDSASQRPIRVIRAIRGSLQKLDRGLHGFHGLTAVSGQSNRGRPNTFLKLRDLRALCGETKLRSRKSLIFRIGLLQVVDFHYFSRFFLWCLWCPFAVVLRFLKVQQQLMQVVDFHDIFRYFSPVFNRKHGKSSARASTATRRAGAYLSNSTSPIATSWPRWVLLGISRYPQNKMSPASLVIRPNRG